MVLTIIYVIWAFGAIHMSVNNMHAKFPSRVTLLARVSTNIILACEQLNMGH
jgi:hypothetical protein